MFPEPPTRKLAIVKQLARSVLHNLRRPNPAHQVVPQRNVPSRQAQWFVLSQLDSATVSTPDGRGVTFRRRDPQLFRAHAAHARSASCATSAAAWPELRRRYREALPELTSRESWAREVFGRALTGQRTTERPARPVTIRTWCTGWGSISGPPTRPRR